MPKLLFGVPGFPQGIPTADVSGLSNFCTVEPSPSAGYDHLIRFRGAAGNIIVTVRVREVEQVFCSQDGGIALADLSQPSPGFVPVSPQQVQSLNPLDGGSDDSLTDRRGAAERTDLAQGPQSAQTPFLLCVLHDRRARWRAWRHVLSG